MDNGSSPDDYTTLKALRRLRKCDSDERRRWPYTSYYKEFLRLGMTLALTALIASLLPGAFAQAPVNDVVSWPPGLLLLATLLYASLGTSSDLLWDIEPITGIFLFYGLPKVNIPTMQQVNWISKVCHFVSDIKTIKGVQNMWVRANDVSASARAKALKRTLSKISCVTYLPSQIEINPKAWSVSSAGIMISNRYMLDTPSKPDIPCPAPVARDFLLFAAIDYHVFREWEVQILSREEIVFSTKDMPPSSVVDVFSEEHGVYVAAAQLVRRPHGQSVMRSMAEHTSDDEHGPYILNLDTINRDIPMCAVDFHSYAPSGCKVSATLSELGRAYYRVVNYLKTAGPPPEIASSPVQLIAEVSTGRALWISIFGGATLDTGRVTIQHLPGRWGMKNASPDDAFVSRIDAVLEQLAPYNGITNNGFEELLVSGGISRRTVTPFFVAGLAGQTIISYFLSVGTSAGVWTSVILANSLFTGRLNDLHSLYFGKSQSIANEQPGMKIYLPNSFKKEFMVVATLDRSSPKEGVLRPGLLLNAFGLLAAALGAAFGQETRHALVFGPKVPTPSWILYTSVVFCVGTTLLTFLILLFQQLHEKAWWENAEMPTRWMVYATFPSSLAVCALAIVFKLKDLQHLWPVLDALTCVSGIPLGMIENDRQFSADENTLHLVLLNRWMMAAVASALGSSAVRN